MAATMKKFDAVAESRRWKAAVSRQTQGMTRAEVLAYFNRDRCRQGSDGHRVVSYDPADAVESTCIVREDPPNR